MSPLRPISPTAWLVAPVVASLAASVALAIPVRIGGLQAPEPVFAFVPAFAWALARPQVAPPLALIVAGAALDLLWGAPLGLWPACLLAAYAMVFVARPILTGQEFLALWAAYGLACAGGMATGLLIMTVRAGHAPSLIGVGLQWAVSTALFPFAWRLLERYEATDARFR